MPKIDLPNAPVRVGSGYPAPFDAPCQQRQAALISEAGGLSQFGARVVTLPPGAWSSQRHWHSHEDELVYIVSGHPTLVDDDGPQTLSPGDFTAHPGGDPNGHHMKNETETDVVFLVIGTRAPETDSGHYPDIDLAIPANGTPKRVFTNKKGEPY